MLKYVLITPARNEEAFIRETLNSVVSQTQLPERWIIVDDASTDSTPSVVAEYAQQYRWIELLSRPPRADRNFAGKAHAFNAGLERVREVAYDVIGNLDADISFEPGYMEFLLGRFAANPKLGVAGTPMVEAGFDTLRDSYYNENDVYGACQLFRRECFEQVGGYTPVKWGGIDWIGVRTARYKGWVTRSFAEKTFFHHRPMGATETNIWRARFEYGRKDYFLGNHPLWQVFRVAFQMLKRPYGIGGALLLFGYLHSLITRVERPVSPELLAFHRREQLERLRSFFLGRGRLRQSHLS